MKLTIFTLLVLCWLAVSTATEEEYDYEEEPAAPVTPAAKPASGRLGGLLNSRARTNIGRGKTAIPVEEDDEEEEPLDDVQEQEEVQTTTEPSKKVRGGVRPFRSNEDLLAALKRRRAQVGPGSNHHRESATHAPAEYTTQKSKASTNSRRNLNTGSNDNSRATSNRGRFGSSRGKPVQEEVQETQREEIQVKAKPYRRG